jgi:hypothetical protein
MRAKHQDLFTKFSETFKPETVQKWEAAVKHWEVDSNKPNPYEEPVNSMFYIISLYYVHSQLTSATTERDIQLQLIQEEEADAARGILPPHKVSSSAFLSTGLDLEEQQ